jgi:hypothetical protein
MSSVYGPRDGPRGGVSKVKRTGGFCLHSSNGQHLPSVFVSQSEQALETFTDDAELDIVNI